MYLSKDTKTKAIDYLELMCTHTGISNHSLGIILRSYHYSAPLIMIIFVIMGNKMLATITITYYLFLVLCWILFNGCFLSMLENRLCDDNFNIVDPLLEFSSMQINYESRKLVSHYVGFCYTILIFGIYLLRFKKN